MERLFQVNSVLVMRYFPLHVSYTIFHMASNVIIVLSLIQTRDALFHSKISLEFCMSTLG